MLPTVRHGRKVLVGLAAAGTFCLLGCSSVAAPDPTATTEPAPASPESAGLEETDFGNLSWVFRPGGNLPETVQVDLVDGKAEDGLVQYSLGEVVHAELTGDEQIDAAVQLTRLDGNAIDEQWYLWVATADGPAQVTLPVARMARCGTVTHSVQAVDGGVQIHESRRNIGEDVLACTDTGSDERARVVSAIEARNDGEWWPVQTGPVGGFGGLCPTAAEYESVPYDGELHAAPDATVDAGITNGAEVGVFALEPWPIYGEPFPGWKLVGVQQDGVMSCGWVETP